VGKDIFSDLGRKLVILACCGVVLLVLLSFVTRNPINFRIKIALIWLLVIPLSYEILAGQEPSTISLAELPGLPAGSTWQPKPPRPKRPARITPREQATRETMHVLRRLGFSEDETGTPKVDLLARSSDGRSLVVKICEREAGVLACQDTMRAMIEKGATQAVVIAPHGATNSAKRFVKRIRGRKGLHIRILKNPNSLEERAQS